MPVPTPATICWAFAAHGVPQTQPAGLVPFCCPEGYRGYAGPDRGRGWGLGYGVELGLENKGKGERDFRIERFSKVGRVFYRR